MLTDVLMTLVYEIFLKFFMKKIINLFDNFLYFFGIKHFLK